MVCRDFEEDSEAHSEDCSFSEYTSGYSMTGRKKVYRQQELVSVYRIADYTATTRTGPENRPVRSGDRSCEAYSSDSGRNRCSLLFAVQHRPRE